ncbi:MAG: 8-amino-7-oxononanoate synthase [Bacteroidota bacterium]
MLEFPKKLLQKLKARKVENTLRQLPQNNGLVDFSSNDYLGFAREESITGLADAYLKKHALHKNGATGSRLLSGNHPLYQELETMLTNFHGASEALVFNSGYDANVGFFSSVPQRDDFVLYDEYIHASIRDGIQMGRAKSHKFRHNDLNDLKGYIERIRDNGQGNDIYVVTESVFSMDGDTPDLRAMADLCHGNNLYLIVDEAHASGIFGNGKGLICEEGLESYVFARIVTFGKAFGCHGAAILGSKDLKSFLVNFARSFIYTTAMPPHTVATVLASYGFLVSAAGMDKCERLKANLQFFKDRLKVFGITEHFIASDTAIQSAIRSGNEKVKTVSYKLRELGFDVKPILSPTVPQGQERLRFCLHSYNTKKEMDLVLKYLKLFLTE